MSLLYKRFHESQSRENRDLFGTLSTLALDFHRCP